MISKIIYWFIIDTWVATFKQYECTSDRNLACCKQERPQWITPNLYLDDAEYGITSYSSAHRVGNLLHMLGILFLSLKKSLAPINMKSF